MASSRNKPIPTNGVTVALIYTRVSSDDQAREGLSLPAQLAECRAYAARLFDGIAGEYSDVMSGKRDDRPAYQALLAEARRLTDAKQRAAVVVAALDRFGRKVLERVRSREELKAAGVPTHSVREGGEVSDLIANILASVAQDESERLGRRVKATNAQVRARGWWKPGRIPWGYATRPADAKERAAGGPKVVLVVDPITAPVVQEAFRRVAAGESVRSVVRWVATLPDAARGRIGAPEKRQQPPERLAPAAYRLRRLTHAPINALLRSPVYAGREPDGTPGNWTALVDPATWDAAQARLDGHAKQPHQASGRYLLTGLLRCPLCGARMNGDRKSDGSPRYHCQRWACGFTAPLALVDPPVLGAVLAVLDAATDPDLDAKTRAAYAALRQAGGRDDAARRVAGLEREATDARRRMTDATRLLVDGVIDKAAYDDLFGAERARLAAAEGELARLEAGRTPEATLPPLDDVLRLAGSWRAVLDAADVPTRRDALGALIERVVPVRVRRGVYAPEVAWTPLGAALMQVTEAATSEAA